MKLVLTLLVRDEADILDANLAYHLDRGVDFVIATDNNSRDGTVEILEEYRRMGYLHLIEEPREDYAQSEWVSRMAHLAADSFGADWIIHADADEFWWPREGTLKDVFASIPPGLGVLNAHRLDFIPRPREDGFFADRMTVRVEFPDKTKVAHRPDPEVVVGQGSHRLDRTALSVAPPLYLIDVLHFPLRSYAQFEQKIATAGEGTGVKHWHNAYGLHDRGELRASWDESLLDDTTVERMIAAHEPAPSNLWVGRSSKRPFGVLVEDTRLRDHLQLLRTDATAPDAVSPTGFRLERPSPAEPQPDPEIAVALEVVARSFAEGLKSYTIGIKQERRERKERLQQHKAARRVLEQESSALRKEIARLEKRVDDLERELEARRAASR